MDERTRRVAGEAARQYGLFTRTQALRCGFTASAIRRRLASGLWTVVQPGVIGLAGAPESSRRSRLAACLAAGPEAVVSHRAAANLWGFEGAWFEGVEVMSPRWLRRPRGNAVLHETQDLRTVDKTVLAGIPVASPLRVVLDVGCMVGPTQLEQMVVEGIRRGWFSFRDVTKRHRQVARRGRNGAGRLRHVLRAMDEQDALAQSGWEIRLAKAITDMGFPRPVRQFRILDERGDFVAQVDLAYPRLRLAIEADSETWHTGNARFHRDRTRWNRIRAIGWEVLVYTYEHYRRDRAHIERTLRASLRARAAANRRQIA